MGKALQPQHSQHQGLHASLALEYVQRPAVSLCSASASVPGAAAAAATPDTAPASETALETASADAVPARAAATANAALLAHGNGAHAFEAEMPPAAPARAPSSHDVQRPRMPPGTAHGAAAPRAGGAGHDQHAVRTAVESAAATAAAAHHPDDQCAPAAAAPKAHECALPALVVTSESQHEASTDEGGASEADTGVHAASSSSDSESGEDAQDSEQRSTCQIIGSSAPITAGGGSKILCRRGAIHKPRMTSGCCQTGQLCLV